MFCNNCGVKGHLFRTCNEPITSCGLILIDAPSLPVEPESIRVLMIRRKDSMAFTEFLKGKYRADDHEYVKRLLSNMTISELNQIRTLSFDELWTILWGPGYDYHSKNYKDSKQKFDAIQKSPLIQETTTLHIEPEWGFPKGRRMHKENDIRCAIREFTEETNIPRESYVVCKNLVFQEIFHGTNNVEYKHIYFLAFMRSPEMVNVYQNLTPDQRKEVSCVSWVTLEECRLRIRPHYTQRFELIDTVERSLKTFDLQDNVAVSQT
jgi:8-oxo-dGTP pyrophosphatase MutT (NUDIX family)